MSAESSGHLIGEAPLCAECGSSLQGAGFAFRDSHGAWVHQECGLKLGNDEIRRRGMSLRKVSGGRGFPTVSQEKLAPKTTAWMSMSLRERHEWVNDNLLKESGLEGYSPEFRKSQGALRKKLERECLILKGVNQERLERRLEPVPDWASWKRMDEIKLAPLPGPKQSAKGGCLRAGILIALVVVGLFFLVPMLLTLFF